jgi:hypothetical protein
MTNVTLPDFFTSDYEGGMYYSQGDRVYGTITQRGTVIEYKFNDGSRTYTEEIKFVSEFKAIKAATRMANKMRSSSHSIPHMGTFKALFENCPWRS